MKEQKRQRHARRLKEKLEAMRYEKLEQEINSLPKHEREHWRKLIKYGELKIEKPKLRYVCVQLLGTVGVEGRIKAKWSLNVSKG